MARVYIYVVDRDFGFAPNPFHGSCTLATCKPAIRSTAKCGDWIFGMGGSRLKATGRCIFAMLVSEARSFDDYWASPVYFDKRPVRNGSSCMMVGDNIYHFDHAGKKWQQADSHHSNSDGSINIDNLRTDTKPNRMLISRRFFYFGRSAPLVPESILGGIGYKNGRQHRVFELGECTVLLDWLYKNFGAAVNTVQADPFDFEKSSMRYSAKTNKIS